MSLRRRDLQPDPLAQFDLWFDEIQGAGFLEPTAVTLATTDRDGRPSARVVLLKGHDAHGFRFFTNYASRKGRALDATKVGALLFWWDKLKRQVRVEGEVVRLAAEASDAYFASRPRGSQLGAHASKQSEALASKEAFRQAVAEVDELYRGSEVPRPATWGGYSLRPDRFEFWQEGDFRLHDRFAYSRVDGDGSENGRRRHWRIDRLFP